MNDEILDFIKHKLDEDYYEKFIYAFNAGKRIRPRLMKDICDFLGKNFHPLLAAAAAVEVMHCVSLTHDDVVDKEEMRRDKKPFYKKYGTNSAVLFGDLFATIAIEIFAEEYPKDMHLEFIKTFKSMIEGQIMELENKIQNLNSYFDYIEKKTSSLFLLCVRIPLMYYGIKNDKIEEFSKEFALLFQIANDLVDEGDKEISILNFITREEVNKLAQNKLNNLRDMKIGRIDEVLDIFDGVF